VYRGKFKQHSVAQAFPSVLEAIITYKQLRLNFKQQLKQHYYLSCNMIYRH